MEGMKKRFENPSPQIEYSEINIPTKSKISTGSYLIVVKPNFLNRKEVISSIMLNPPIFQISVNINPSTKKIPILLGRADSSTSISKKTFILPEIISEQISYNFKVTFKDWNILELYMNGKSLKNINNQYNFNRVDFFMKHVDILEKVFPKDFFNKGEKIDHPAYSQWMLCKKIIKQKGIVKLPEQKDEIPLIGKIVLGSMIHSSLSNGNVQDIEFGLIELYGDKNVQKFIESRIKIPENFNDIMLELYFASWHKMRKHDVSLIEKESYPDIKIMTTNLTTPLYTECKNIKSDTYKRLNSVIKKANKQIKATKTPCYGIVVLDISTPVTFQEVKNDKLPERVDSIKDSIVRILSGEKNRSISAAVLIWDDYLIVGNPTERIMYAFRKRFHIVEHSKVEGVNTIPENLSIFEGNTVTYGINLKKREI